MKIEIKVPSPGESISEVQLVKWLVENEVFVEKNQEIAEIDSDKATLSIAAESAGTLKILIEAGETVNVGGIIAIIDTSATSSKKDKNEKPKPINSNIPQEIIPEKTKVETINEVKKEGAESNFAHTSPLAQKLMIENQVDENQLIHFFKNQIKGPLMGL